ncbi:N-acetylmuramoyl-L-alanine amidase [Halobacillus salinus]|uniref:N-acetylmuramoyl-L-alanine amidase n=1 Tax=Halobacillus salinus TaxID=192814 RepID=UPI0009A6FA55|nr:N-acetylmuramoyl-L-alanine amidase [Halobacillus salinus]
MFKGKWRVLAVALVSFLALTVLPVSVSAASLSDVPDAYADEVEYLIDQGIVTGYTDNTFKPKNKVTRKEAATMIGKALDLNGTKRSTSFPDVSKSLYASGYIQSAYEKGVISGYPDNTYKPDNNMTRGEMAYLIVNAFSLNAESGINYSDVPNNTSLETVIDKLSTAGIAEGYGDGTYHPKEAISREHFAVLVARAMNPDFNVDSQSEVIAEKVVSTGVLNVRSGPGTDYNRVGKVYEGNVVKIYKYQGSWAKIAFDGSTAWVHTDYIMEKRDEDAPQLVAIDAGHGDHDGGASDNGLVEKDVNLAVARETRDYLKQFGLNVIMTRSDDTFLELNERVDYAVDRNADTFVSIHANASGSEYAEGVETYYSSAALSDRAYKSKKLAQFIQDRLVAAMNSNDRGVKEAPFRVIHATPLPSSLVELGFLTNDSDASKLGSSYYRDKAGKAIALGIRDYYTWKQSQ